MKCLQVMQCAIAKAGVAAAIAIAGSALAHAEALSGTRGSTAWVGMKYYGTTVSNHQVAVRDNRCDGYTAYVQWYERSPRRDPRTGRFETGAYSKRHSGGCHARPIVHRAVRYVTRIMACNDDHIWPISDTCDSAGYQYNQ